MRKIAVVAAVLVAGLTVTGGKNLQHYPKDMSEDDLEAEMKVLDPF